MRTGKLLADNQVINPLLYNISMHILHTVLFTYIKENILNNQALVA